MAVAVHATAAEVDEMTSVLSAAFADDPVQQWLFEPADDPEAGRRALFEVFTPDYFWLGHSYVVHGPGDGDTTIRGAALWAPPDRNPLQGERVQELLDALVPHLGDQTVPRLSELARAAEYRPPVPHFYLGVLGVDPAAQAQGLGAALVAPVLAECDRTGCVAHLESSNPRNLAFYERHGFVIEAEYRCGGDARMTIMTRQPR